ncbi:hypothetical protein RJT34_13469 [Clitoria ternatea]|uniref:Ubiquitin-like protease family profile domain-containing protein n=1 Tax=Clitoria ternatea TaxID=43366 RepID=A0AAN9JP01_CLITE
MTRRTRSSSTSSSSSTKKFQVFEFDDEDEKIEKLSQRMLSKFTNPSTSRSSPITKYDFLQAFAHVSQPPSKNVAVTVTADPIDVDAEQEEEAKRPPEEVTDKPLEVVVVDDDDDDDEDYSDSDGSTGTGIANREKCDNPCPINMAMQDCAGADFVECEFDLKNQSLDVVSDDEDGIGSSETSSFSTSTTSNSSEDEVNFGDQLLVEHVPVAFEINSIEKVVDVIPDYIQYGDLYSTRSRLIFSCSSLKLEGSTINGTRETFKIEWATEDIIKIESRWFGNIETAWINLLLKQNDFIEADNTNLNPGVRLLTFAVYDSCWYKAEEAIKLLDARYADMWSAFFDIDTDNNGNIFALGQDGFFCQKRYFRPFDEAFEEVIYPKGEPDAVSIRMRDIELLQPQTFINDTIIDFYIKYLKSKLPTDEQERFHFFNSFFFRKLADLDKDPSSACDGRAAFQRVRKWTRKVNLFEKDYILIPVNYSLHWSLIVICHPGEMTCFTDEEIKKSSKVPCVLHMDSLRGSHKGLKNLFQSYLCEEWKERHSNMVDDVSSKFLHMRFVSLELPQQGNLYDCGLFLLHYVECFLKEAPTNINPFMITKFSNFLTSNWFPPAEASLKRSHIQNLIYDISVNNSLQAPPADCLDRGLPSEVPGIIINHRVEADSSGDCYYSALLHGEIPSTTELETDSRYSTASLIRGESCLRDPGSVFKDLQVAVGTSLSNCLPMPISHQRGFMSPIKETEESDEENVLSLERENSQVGVLASDLPSTSYVSKDHRTSGTSQHGFSVNFMKPVESHSCSRTSTSVSWITLNTLEDQPLENIEESSIPDKTAFEYLSTTGEELADAVQDSQEPIDVDDDDGMSVKHRSSFQENMTSVTHERFDLAQNSSLEDDTLGSKKESPDHQDAKRPKLMNAGGSGRRFTRSMVKQVCNVL